ncbi:MAG: DNA-directed RNA polymerase subunit B [Nitrososphaerota archaeon]|nr:DNA-directed RNA polymerase subunit B [Nitrososphaerota archaeon]MDG6974981.1 DNA-directed RNA polymerase subunit B [Nitrososphaerota archaeon]MDG7009260.1 DNA-directed RNA polymerase subunit B [Nitrososphaerota archaeon]MDG7018891.1 DNA-directed RNA polymerase subunit B [Nitrososphaerota archaeon]
MSKQFAASNSWVILSDLLQREGVARQHLNSYNEFVTRGLQNIADEINEVEIETVSTPYKVKFGRVTLGSPRVVEIDGSVSSILPMESRLRNLTYSAPILLEMTIEEEGLPRDTTRQHIGDLPVMVKSELCQLSNRSREQLIESGEDPNDPGGYFIIHGAERVIVGLEDLSPNKILVDAEKLAGATTYKSRVYSSVVGYRSKLELTLKQDGGINVKIPSCPVDLPYVIVMRALGIKSDRDIANAVSPKQEIQDLLEVSFDKASEAPTEKDALVYIGNRVAHGMLEEFRVKRALSTLDWGLLPHLGKTEDRRFDKSMFMGEAACKLLELRLGWIEADDKDHYGNKVIKFAGQMLADLFRTAFRNLVRDMKYQLERTGQKRGGNVVGAAIRTGIITDKLNNAIATGNWGRGKVGVTQLLDRTNYLSTLSHLRRVQSPLSRSQPNFEARDLHATHFGRICPSETPEGVNCGLVKNLALSAIISVSVPSQEVEGKLWELGAKQIRDSDEKLQVEGCRIFMDGRFLGYVDDGERLAKAFRKLRREGQINPSASVLYISPVNDNAYPRIYISLSSGRVLRPLVVVESGRPLLNPEMISKVSGGQSAWRDLVDQGTIELIDANEEENCLVAMGPEDVTTRNSHMELFPAAMFGIAASIIPYPEHNQSPRNTYESAMAKQSLGFSSPTYPISPHVRQHLLVSPQAPVVRTRTLDLLKIDERPLGTNCVVAVLSFEGYNIEDAIIMNKSSVERGMARSFFYRLYDGEAKQYLGGMRDTFEVPSAESNIRGYRGEKFYRLLEGDGVVAHESQVAGGDVVIGRTSPPRFMEEYKEFEIKGPYRRDTSVAVRPSEAGVVDSIFMTENVEGGKMFKVRVRDMRVPEIGDKFASRHGQKGVIGLVVPQEDMPYTAEGIVPDVIINPHAFPSRMTVGQFIESIAGKAAAFRGSPVDGSAFAGESIDEMEKVLRGRGFEPTGREVMYDGKTGKKFATDVFVGVVYYQKLHHMVADKIHARARGQVQMLTKQPTEGRARGGGLRFGEMERDCLIAYGASMVLKDRLLDEADKTEIYVCERCGLIAYYDAKQRKYTCKIDGDQAKISTVVVAYAFKLLLQEMMSLNIAPRLQLKDKV